MKSLITLRHAGKFDKKLFLENNERKVFKNLFEKNSKILIKKLSLVAKLRFAPHTCDSWGIEFSLVRYFTILGFSDGRIVAVRLL
jgi:hypothetical protein